MEPSKAKETSPPETSSGFTTYLKIGGVLLLLLLVWMVYQDYSKVIVRPTGSELDAFRSGTIFGFARTYHSKNKTFLCEGKEWVCLPNKPLCQNGKKYLREDYRPNTTNTCLEPLRMPYGVRSKGRYCIKSEGKGNKARLWATLTLSRQCDKKQFRTITLEGWFDESNEFQMKEEWGSTK